ncbi:MAG: hypothetical protein IJU69_01555 [Bacteroidales bacterium]|nr:hypothetical protein [Bacteroidales bacterium]
MSNSDKWLDEVARRLDNFVDTVPEGAWEAISAGVARKKRQKRAALITVAALLGAAAAITPVILFRDGETTGNDIPVNTPYIAQNEVPPATETAISEPITEAPVPPRRNKVSEPEAETAIIETAEPETVIMTKPETKPVVEENDFERLLASLTETEDDETPRRRIGISLGGNLGFASDRSADIWSSFVASLAKVHPENQSDGLDYANLNGSDKSVFYGLDLTRNSPVIGRSAKTSSAFQYRHYFPVSVKLALSFPISGRFAVETGATYSLLRSAILFPAPEGEQNPYQVLHFIGLPAGLRYSIYEMGRTSIYASAGGALEICVSARINGVPIDLKELFWSANCSGGVQVTIARGLGLFLEAGGSYHFRNNAFTYTIYDDNPLQFSLQAGLRIQKQ